MHNPQKFIESGILELYVLGKTCLAENELVVMMSNLFTEVFEEIVAIEISLEKYALNSSVAVNATIKPFVLATIDFTERLQNGEPVTFPPILNANSNLRDFYPWLKRSDMVLPPDFEEIHAKIIGYNKEAITAIIWLKSGSPKEIHHDEYEKFMIIEGTCTITIDKEDFNLKSGDVLSIPLYKEHYVKVTSSIPCKVILQRIAA